MSYFNEAEYREEIEAWRAQRERELRAPDSWLSLAGLFVLKEGYHTLGSDPNNDIVLPASAPAHLGVIEFRKQQARLNITTAELVYVDGKTVRQADLVDNSNRQQPTLVTTGTVIFFLHNFGDQYAIRVKDTTNPAIQAFAGCEWFAIKPTYRVQGKFVPYGAPHALPIRTIVKTASTFKSVGTVEFALSGYPLSLAVADAGGKQLSTIFRDATAGKQTYPALRFLTLDGAAAGDVIVDFNKAYNPPSAVSVYATCPLPPRENILPAPIEAGERYTPNEHASYYVHELITQAA